MMLMFITGTIESMLSDGISSPEAISGAGSNFANNDHSIPIPQIHNLIHLPLILTSPKPFNLFTPDDMAFLANATKFDSYLEPAEEVVFRAIPFILDTDLLAQLPLTRIPDQPALIDVYIEILIYDKPLFTTSSAGKQGNINIDTIPAGRLPTHHTLYAFLDQELHAIWKHACFVALTDPEAVNPAFLQPWATSDSAPVKSKGSNFNPRPAPTSQDPHSRIWLQEDHDGDIIFRGGTLSSSRSLRSQINRFMTAGTTVS